MRKYIPSGVIDLVKMEALDELVLGHILSAICPWGIRLDLPMESNLSTAESHLVLFNATLQFKKKRGRRLHWNFTVTGPLCNNVIYETV